MCHCVTGGGRWGEGGRARVRAGEHGGILAADVPDRDRGGGAGPRVGPGVRRIHWLLDILMQIYNAYMMQVYIECI